MHEEAHHCPFLNRTDARCSTNFSLDRLHQAFAHCFGQYQECRVYAELLVERRLRRSAACGWQEGSDVSTPLVQITLHRQTASHRHHQHAA